MLKKVKVYVLFILFVLLFINKYYILDLDEKKLVVKGLLDVGFSVFMIFWVNFDKFFVDYDFVSYMKYGFIVVLDVVCDIIG